MALVSIGTLRWGGRQRHLRRLTPTEHQVQVTLFEWAAASIHTYPVLELLYAIPNASKASDLARIWNAAEGLRRGMPDVCLPESACGYKSLYIEHKREDKRGQTLPDHQREMHERLRRWGHAVVVSYSFEESRHAIVSYIEGVFTPRGSFNV